LRHEHIVNSEEPRYLRALLARWWLVVGLAITGAVLVGLWDVVTARTASVFTASTDVLLTGAKYRVQLDPRFTTVDPNSPTALPPGTTRADEYRAVALSREVRAAAAANLAPPVRPGEQSEVGELNQGIVDARVKGNLITVTASSNEVGRAAQIADAYAGAVAQRLDRVYGTSDQDQQSLAQKLKEAVAAHQEAQAKFTAALAEGRADALARDLTQKDTVRTALVREQNVALTRDLATAYAEQTELDRLQRDAQVLQRQITEGGRSSASTLAHVLALSGLETRFVDLPVDVPRDSTLQNAGTSANRGEAPTSGRESATGDNPTGTRSRSASAPFVPQQPRQSSTAGNGFTQLQVNVDTLLGKNSSREELLADANALMRSVEQRRGEVSQKIGAMLKALNSQVVGPGTPSAVDPTTRQLIDGLSADIEKLQAEQREETFRMDVLRQNVELAGTARSTLENKLQEASIAGAAGAGRAIIASSASSATVRSYPPALSRVVPIGFIAGALVGAALAIGLYWFFAATGGQTPVGDPDTEPGGEGGADNASGGDRRGVLLGTR
jgi:hypothetical protein